MYAEAGLLFPYMQGLDFFQDSSHHHLQLQLQLQEEEELLRRLRDNGLHDDYITNNNSTSSNNQTHLQTIITPPVSTLVNTSTISEYDLGGEGDLFKAPEPIIGETLLALDPVTAAISMMSSGEDIITADAIKVADIESIETDHLLSEVFYECKKDLLAKSAIEELFLELPDVKFQELQIENNQNMEKDKLVEEVPIQKSVSSGCLDSRDWTNGTPPARLNFIDFQEMDLGAAFGLRRAYSEGDIKTLGNGGASVNTSVHLPVERMLSMDSYKIEERRQKLSRYRKKRTKRNFGRKIKYACRKALADSQPRVRGRFAKTEEIETARTSKKKCQNVNIALENSW